jgi:hypothetical protein
MNSTAVAFLRAVLPETGFYGITTLAKRQPPHREVARTSRDISNRGHDVYFTVGSFRAARGKQDISNIDRLKCLRVDVDCGKDECATLEEAGFALDEFCNKARLPTPWLVFSGRGLHCYWPLQKEITTKEWLPYARGLKAACECFGFKADPVVTADCARILRCPGTSNWKDPNRPLPVTLAPSSLELGLYPLSAFDHLLNAGEKGPSKETSAKPPSAPTVYSEAIERYYVSALNAVTDVDERKTWLDAGRLAPDASPYSRRTGRRR